MYIRQLLAIASLLFFSISYADDTDLFIANLPTAAQPNVLFIMDTSGSMGAGAGTNSRMEVAKGAARAFVQSAENINISLMSFNSSSQGGKVDFASEDIDTGRQRAIDVINGYSADGVTPLNETLYEAYLYFSGQAPRFGGNSVSAARNGSNYRSPIVNECQKSSIVLFTDGYPFFDTDANGAVQSLVRGQSLPSGLSSSCSGEGGCLDELAWYMFNNDVRSGISNPQHITTYTIAGFGGAPPALLTSAANHGGGQFYEASNSSQLSQALDDILLRVNSESSSFSAPATSVSAFNSLETAEDVYYIVFRPDVSPGWRGNLKRYRLGDDNNLYDANGNLAIDPATGFFSEQAKSFWSSSADGKNVEPGGMAEHLTQGRPVFTSVTGDRNITLSSSGNRLHESNTNITSAMLGTVDDADTRSVLQWARGVDIDDQDSDGGTNDDRTGVGDPLHTQPYIITYYKNNDGSQVDKNIYFTTNDGFLHSVNTDNGTTEFSYIPSGLLANLKKYREGKVLPVVPEIGPTSNSQCVWNYQVPGSCVPVRWCKYEYQFGDIHLNQSCRLDRPPQSDGDCRWDYGAARCANGAYCEYRYQWGDFSLDQSCRLRGNLPPPPKEPEPDNAKIYGMDGPMSVWIADHNGDGDLLTGFRGSVDSGEHAYLYLTMRRGGSNVYALDITNRANPVLKWVIRGDRDFNHQVDSVTINPEFPELGQTWSKAMVTRVQWQGRERRVLLFGGGYDQDADTQSVIAANDIGRAIYMVDASTGELLWSAGSMHGNLRISEMAYSIPGELALIDINQDGLTDYLFAVDIGGQLFRIDINPNNTLPANFASGGLIARLSGNTAENARRFFEAPVVSLAKNREYLHIAVGSGTRPTPMNTAVNDRMYVIRDPNINNKPVSYRYSVGNIITESSLYDATANIIQNGSEFQKRTELARLEGSLGWYLRLGDAGEKVLVKATILNGVLLFTSFVPQISSNSCSPGVGLNYFYALDIEDGQGILDSQTLGTPTRRMLLKSKSLAPAPSVISQGGQMQVCIGSECLSGNNQPLQGIGKRTIRSFWRENR